MSDQEKVAPEVPPDVDPVEFLRRMLAISPEDAKEAREQAARDAEGDQGE